MPGGRPGASPHGMCALAPAGASGEAWRSVRWRPGLLGGRQTSSLGVERELRAQRCAAYTAQRCVSLRAACARHGQAAWDKTPARAGGRLPGRPPRSRVAEPVRLRRVSASHKHSGAVSAERPVEGAPHVAQEQGTAGVDGGLPVSLVVPASMARGLGSSGGATLQRSKLDLAKEVKTVDPRVDDSGGGGNNGKNIFNGGGGGDDGGDGELLLLCGWPLQRRPHICMCLVLPLPGLTPGTAAPQTTTTSTTLTTARATATGTASSGLCWRSCMMRPASTR